MRDRGMPSRAIGLSVCPPKSMKRSSCQPACRMRQRCTSPGRMVMVGSRTPFTARKRAGLLGIEDRKAHRHRIEKRWIGEPNARPLVVLLDVEQQFVASDRHGVCVHQRSLLADAAVFVGRKGLEQFPRVALLAGKVDAYACGRLALIRVKCMGAELGW